MKTISKIADHHVYHQLSYTGYWGLSLNQYEGDSGSTGRHSLTELIEQTDKTCVVTM